MAGAVNASGMVTGINWNQIIQQLMQVERQPITRIQQRISTLQQQQTAIRDLRNLLFTVSNRARDFRTANVFSQFTATSSETGVLTATVSGQSPVTGSYSVNVTQLASATVALSSAKMGASINPNVALSSSGISTAVTAGKFTINGVEFTVDPATQSLNDILSAITSSSAGVNATYDSLNDKVVLTNKTAGDTSIINIGATGDDSNFLTAVNLRGASQGALGDGTTQVTSTRNLGAVVPGTKLQDINFANGAVTAGLFRINGVAITVDPANQSLSDIISAINNSNAGVTATYDSVSDGIRVVSKEFGSRTIAFGSPSDTSNFLSVVNLTTATQTVGRDATFSIDGGPTQTRSTNQISDAIGGLTLNLLSTGTSMVTVANDDEAAVTAVRNFLSEINNAVSRIQELTRRNGTLEADYSIRSIQDYLRSIVFSTVSGATGDYQSLVDVGVSTGSTFDSSTISDFQLDEEKFREALRTNRSAVAFLFSNTGATGVGDRVYNYLNDVTGLNGFLNQRSRSNGLIDQQIQAYNDRISRLEDRIQMKEQRLRAQFTRMEQYASSFQQQGTSLSGLASMYSSLGF
ncbi:MAG TPA: flagellar filament capping protein FliD [Candidatus Hydrogenedentes bacterium]|nr:flagellar filament capping protein FliD [Candidatus Hydrogenedentota bacterium]HOL77973.1 flagellar filament capping protein FliD [Candidatus Hydrogenedentota bacterium]HPO87400.1 flagellar filament capping protein FliD [Candidatus Hydrogenedentota bacterium]